jgi:hypothetical protein
MAFFGATILISVLILQSSVQITKEQVDRIQRGMGYVEVEAILGCPPGDYTTQPIVFPATEGQSNLVLNRRENCHQWVCDSGMTFVWFDPEGRSVEKAFYPAIGMGGDPFSKLLWRAKRQWRKWFPEKRAGV